MSNDRDNEGFRRFDDETRARKTGMFPIVVSALFLIFWTGIVIAALINIMNTGADIFAILIVLCIGGIGIIGIAKSLIKRIRNLN